MSGRPTHPSIAPKNFYAHLSAGSNGRGARQKTSKSRTRIDHAEESDVSLSDVVPSPSSTAIMDTKKTKTKTETKTTKKTKDKDNDNVTYDDVGDFKNGRSEYVDGYVVIYRR